MALRREDLIEQQGAVILEFPTAALRGRLRAQRRIERRRRTVLVAAASAALVALWHMPSDVEAQASPGARPASVEVRAGETLWDVASTYAPEGTDLRAYVGRIQVENGLDGAVRPGEVLRLPR